MCRLWGWQEAVASLGPGHSPAAAVPPRPGPRGLLTAARSSGPARAALLGRKELRWAGPRAEGLWVREAGPACWYGREGGAGAGLCRPFPGDTGAPRGGVPAQWGRGGLREGQGGDLQGWPSPLRHVSLRLTAHAACPRVSLLGSPRAVPPDALSQACPSRPTLALCRLQAFAWCGHQALLANQATSRPLEPPPPRSPLLRQHFSLPQSSTS